MDDVTLVLRCRSPGSRLGSRSDSGRILRGQGYSCTKLNETEMK